jgi:hypothetical protein
MDFRRGAIIGDSSSVLPTTSYSSTEFGADRAFTPVEQRTDRVLVEVFQEPLDQPGRRCLRIEAGACQRGRPVVREVHADGHSATQRSIVGETVRLGVASTAGWSSSYTVVPSGQFSR